MPTRSNEQPCRLAQAGDTAARDILLENNLGFIRKIALEQCRSMDLDENDIAYQPFLSLMLPRKGQPFPPEHRNYSHTFRGVLQFRLPSAPQKYNTLDFPGKVVCHETAGFFGFFQSKGNSIPSEHPRQRESPCQQGRCSLPIGEPMELHPSGCLMFV